MLPMLFELYVKNKKTAGLEEVVLRDPTDAVLVSSPPATARWTWTTSSSSFNNLN